MSRAGAPHHLRRFGVEQLPPAEPAFSPADARQAAIANPALSASLPEFMPISVGFDVIPVTAGMSISAGNSAWYGLERVIPIATLQTSPPTAAQQLANPIVIGQQFYLNSIAGEMRPCDKDGNGLTGVTGINATGGGAPEALAWGDRTGLTAAILIGVNLPITKGAWTQAPCVIPGLETNAAGTRLQVNAPRHIARLRWPTGQINDTTDNFTLPTRSYGALVNRFIENMSLDVALVVRGSQINGASANKYLVGFLDLTMTIGVLRAGTDLTQQQ